MNPSLLLYLTSAEQSVFHNLPSDVRGEWIVESEEGTAYESDEVLSVRAGMTRFESYPELKAIALGVLSERKIDQSILEGIPESILPELFFTIGARGLTALIGSMLPATKTDEDMAGLAGLTSIRHDILQTNASISYL